MRKMYLIKIGDKYVSSPWDKLTQNKEFAGVFTDENIDYVFSFWDKKSDGNADIIDFKL